MHIICYQKKKVTAKENVYLFTVGKKLSINKIKITNTTTQR